MLSWKLHRKLQKQKTFLWQRQTMRTIYSRLLSKRVKLLNSARENFHNFCNFRKYIKYRKPGVGLFSVNQGGPRNMSIKWTGQVKA